MNRRGQAMRKMEISLMRTKLCILVLIVFSLSILFVFIAELENTATDSNRWSR
jgi:hypothetical protein